MRSTFKRAALATIGVAFAACTGNAKADSTFYGLSDTPDQELIAFDYSSAYPNGGFPITGAHFINGVATSEKLLSIAYGPLGQLYALSSQDRIYELGTNGAATPLGQLTTQLNGTSFGLAIDPLTSDVRVTSNLGQNLLLTLTGQTITQGSAFSYAPGQTINGAPATGTPVIEDVAYGPGPNPILYGLDARSGALVQIGGPGDAGADSGQVVVLGQGGGGQYNPRTSFDISPSGAGFVAQEGLSDPSDTELYQISLTNGSLAAGTPQGEIGDMYTTAIPIRSIATPEPTALSLLAIGGVFLLKRRPR
jgi:hypothetical protein